MESRKDIKVLDLGCGRGVHSVFLLKEGFKVCATDISDIGIGNLRRKLTEEKLTIETLKTESIAEISFPENFFDVIFSIGVFDAAGYEETKKAIPLISKTLKQGGKVFFIFASENDFRIQQQNNEYKLHGYSEKEVESLFCQNDYFQKVWIDKYITTYQNKLICQEDFIVTVFK